MDSYEINYNFTVNECSGNKHTFPSFTVLLADESLRSHTIMSLNSSDTPVEEDSTYSISLIAVNSVTRSTATTISGDVTTDTAGVFYLLFLLTECIAHFSYPVPSGPPQSLMVTSVTVSNITIQWEEVDCVQRNGRISSYFLMYTVDGESMQTSTTDKMFTAVGLQPRTNYTFTVVASHSHLIGSPASITVETAAPQGM